MDIDPTLIAGWAKIATCYLAIGWITQLPGGVYRRYPRFWLVKDNYERFGPRALLDLPFIWIPFTIAFWPIPFLRAGLQTIPVILGIVGLALSLIVILWVHSLVVAVMAAIATGFLACVIFRPRKL